MLKKISRPVVHCFKLTEILFIGRKFYALLYRDINYYYNRMWFYSYLRINFHKMVTLQGVNRIFWVFIAALIYNIL